MYLKLGFVTYLNLEYSIAYGRLAVRAIYIYDYITTLWNGYGKCIGEIIIFRPWPGRRR